MQTLLTLINQLLIIGGEEIIIYIKGLNINGAWEEDPKAIKSEAFRYLGQRFNSFSGPHLTSSKLFHPIQPSKTVSASDRIWLEREFSDEEVVKEAVWDCGSDKARGPDGFNFHIISCEFGNEEFHSHAQLVRGLNNSFITLVPKKKKNPLTLDDFRPTISPIGSLYKIIEKIISPTESAWKKYLRKYLGLQ